MLTDAATRQAKPNGKPRKLTDQRGLYLYVSSSGAKSWRFDYRYCGRRQTLVIGSYPEVSLSAARREHAKARQQLLEGGLNPSALKQERRIAQKTAARQTLQAIAEDWFREVAPHRSGGWRKQTAGWLKNHIYPSLGHRPVDFITSADVLAVVRRLADKGTPQTAESVRWQISRIFRYAVLNQRAKYDPARDLRGAVTVPAPKHHPALAENELPKFIQLIDGYGGRPSTVLAMRLLLLTFVRKNELVEATWQEFDFDESEPDPAKRKPIWRIPMKRMKARQEHLVPLSMQALRCLGEARAFASDSKFVFPHFADLGKPMSGFTLNSAFQSLGYKGRFTPHGIRGTASTILNERGFHPDVIERQLAHVERNRVRAAYNRAEYLEERRKMLQYWADYLENVISPSNVVEFVKRGSVERRKL